MDKDNYYKTSDLALTATLSLSFTLISISPQPNNKSLFIFEKSKKLEELIEKYWSGTLRIEPKVYFNQLKTIKTRLYSNE